MSPLADACAELETWLPEAQARTTIPDTEATGGTRSKPGSKPPWNAQVANALYDALEGVRQLEAMWRSDLAGHAVPLRPMAATGMVLTSIVRLAEAVGEGERRHAVVAVTRWTMNIKVLPAVGEAEQPQHVAAPCPYCRHPMMRYLPLSYRVTCLRFGACFDGDGEHPVGQLEQNRLNGEPQVVWRDGRVT